jgi:small-conductance mechanosensitive channel
MTLSDNAQEIYDWFIGAPFHIILILIIALVLQKVGGRAVARAINRIAEADFALGPKRGLDRQRERARTAGSVLKSALNALIWLIALTMILSELGFNLGPLIASAGVIGESRSRALL